MSAVGVMAGRPASTISRELRRHRHDSGKYRPFNVNRQAALRRSRLKLTKIEVNDQLRQYVSSRLSKKWSPQKTTRSPKAVHPAEPGMYVAADSIYIAIYRRVPRFVVEPDRSPLRAGRDHWQAHFRVGKAGR